jgi:hypothetical protein
MTRRHAPRFALALLERFISDGSPLAGDLIEEFERRQSISWFWWQVLAAIAIAWFERPTEIRPLQLVDLQPADAVERSHRRSFHSRSVNLSASPLSGVGGLGLLVLALHVTVVAPGTWWVLLGSALAGVLIGIALITMHAKSPQGATTIESLSIRTR